MARDHARIKTSIWRDEDFRGLSPDAQLLYLTLVSHPALTRVGVLDFRPGRLAALAAGNTVRRVNAATKSLELSRFVIVDRKTEELLVRTHVRHDGVLDRVNMGKAVGRALEQVTSGHIRGAILTELARYYEVNPTAAGWVGLGELYPDELAMVSAMSSTIPLPMQSGKR